VRAAIFVPFTYGLIALMIFFALKPGLERMVEWRKTLDVIAETGLVIEGDALRGMIVNERAAIMEIGEEPVERLIINSTGVFSAANNSGAHYFVSAEAMNRLRGREVDVVFEVRSPPEGGATEWMSRAFIEGVLDTGWAPQSANPEWSPASVRIAIPDDDVRTPLHLMIWSDAAGNNGAIELRRIELLPADPGLALPSAQPDPVGSG
jgi:hypothetical protein